MNTSFREVSEDDTEALWLCCWPDEPLTTITARIHTCCRWMDRNRAVGLVALSGIAPIGFGQVIFWRERGEISDVIVAEPYRNHGIGTGIIHALVETARRKALSVVEIGVDEDNTRAYEMYARLGFTDSGRRIEDLSGKKVIYLSMALDTHD